MTRPLNLRYDGTTEPTEPTEPTGSTILQIRRLCRLASAQNPRSYWVVSVGSVLTVVTR